MPDLLQSDLRHEPGGHDRAQQQRSGCRVHQGPGIQLDQQDAEGRPVRPGHESRDLVSRDVRPRHWLPGGRVPSVNDGPSAQATTPFDMARLYALLIEGNTLDSRGSDSISSEMLDLLAAAQVGRDASFLTTGRRQRVDGLGVGFTITHQDRPWPLNAGGEVAEPAEPDRPAQRRILHGAADYRELRRRPLDLIFPRTSGACGVRVLRARPSPRRPGVPGRGRGRRWRGARTP
jgi:hypothetical protein